MARSQTILRLAKGLLALTAVLALTSSVEAKRPPNFVLIFMDDQGYQDVGVFGSKTIKTPHLDNMAKEGMKFTDFYSLAPVCSPSRAGLMTGCYPPRVGITGVLFPRNTIGLNPEETTVAEILKTKATPPPLWANGTSDICPNSCQPTTVSTAISESPTPTTWTA